MDTDSIADAEVSPAAIKRATEGSDTFLFVITPSSVESAYCENKVDYARELQKRDRSGAADRVRSAPLPLLLAAVKRPALTQQRATRRFGAP